MRGSEVSLELRHAGDPTRSIESILLSDADALDFLGVIDVWCDFSKNARDLRKAYRIAQQRWEKLPQLICLDKAKVIAAQRSRQTAHFLAAFEADSFGCF